MISDLTIVIPCYNEQNNLTILLKKIQNILENNKFIKIILVDNGSFDQSTSIIKNNSIFNNNNFKLVEIKKNIGYGNGIMQGLKEVETEFYGWTHADLQTDLMDIVTAFKIYKAKLIKGNYIIKGKRKKRNLLDGFFTASMSIITSLLTLSIQNDINAQPKIFSKDIYLKLTNPPNDFMLDLYLMIIAKKNKNIVINYPVFFNERKFGIAKGGGSIRGKIKLSILTIKYLLFKTYR